MTETPVAQGTTSTLPPTSANGPAPPAAAAPRRRMHTRISGIRTALIAVLMAAAGTTRITQLRQIMRRDRRKPRPS